MSNWYLKLTGQFAAAIGRLDKYSDEHLKFLASGYVCSQCNTTLMKWSGVSSVVCLSADGQPVPVLLIRVKGKVFQCPRCKHQWNFRSV